jgi:hypothetical protein
MAEILMSVIAVIGIDIGKTSFHVVGLDGRGAVALRQKWSRGQVEARLANMPPCLIGMEACVGAHHLSRRLRGLGHDARLMPAKYVRPYAKGQKNDFRDAEAIAEAVQRPTMKFGSNLAVGSYAELSAKGSKADMWERASEVAEVPTAEVNNVATVNSASRLFAKHRRDDQNPSGPGTRMRRASRPPNP